MKTCKFCCEQVHDDASRCPHCTSALSGQTGEANHQVTYVLDRGLIRFAKFAGAALAVFLIFGAYAFGFKLEIALERARTLQADADELLPVLRAARDEMKGARQELEKNRLAANALAKELGELREQARRDAREIQMIRVAPPPLTEAQQVRANARAAELTIGTKRPGKLWPNETVLTIRFLDGDAELIARVKAHFTEWLQYTNLRVAYADNNAMIRVSFKQHGSWSVVGTDALGVDQNQPTINFGWLTPQTPAHEVRKAVLHEFGHALGLVHEHQNPYAEIPWDREAVYRELTAPPYSWSRDRVDQLVFNRLSTAEFSNYRPFDIDSIMTYPIPLSWTAGKFEIKTNDTLSRSDIAFIARLYPRRSRV